MTLNDQKNLFSQAWLTALAASAQVNVGNITIDDDSVDMILRRRTHGRPQLDIQLKCTQNAVINQPTFPFLLSEKNYDDLREIYRTIPAILVVLVVPPDCANWLVPQPASHQWHFSHDIFWHSLYGEPALPVGQKSTTVQISTMSRLTPIALGQLFDDIASATFP